ncbi:tyrosine-type recombinase/integrase [Methylobacterium sp.]|uniref:tyrosine-type recombinase/integrase n=2 Tax=Methylobacterium sp. TaxID=409 RepID=UPI003C757F4A
MPPSTAGTRPTEAAAPKPCRTPCPRIRFHDLQHSHATQMSTSGIHPKIAQERLGHSGIGIALDLYSRVMPGMQEDAAAKVDAAMRAAIDKAAG